MIEVITWILIFGVILLVFTAAKNKYYGNKKKKQIQKEVEEIYPEVIRGCLVYARTHLTPQEYDVFVVDFQATINEETEVKNLATIMDESMERAKEIVAKNRS